MTHMASMIAQGVFEKWPSLYFVIIECGVAWVPSVLWRLDSNFGRSERRRRGSKCCRRNTSGATSG
jgi:predicted TIM-barrel fold metal-dependent hydrolase